MQASKRAYIYEHKERKSVRFISQSVCIYFLFSKGGNKNINLGFFVCVCVWAVKQNNSCLSECLVLQVEN